MKNYSSRKGFTLSEVLITIGIIGVVAALTIPNLIVKYQEKQTVTRFKWVYSTLANAFTMAVAENGAPEVWELDDPQDLAEILSKYMRVDEKCYYKKGCLPSDIQVVALTGEARYGHLANDQNRVKEKFGNGISLYYASSHTGCSYTSVDVAGNETIHKNYCGSIYAFITANKFSRLGLDHFLFTVTPKGILPEYYDWNDSYIKRNCNKVNQNTETNTNVNGMTCGEWIRRWGNADYWYD